MLVLIIMRTALVALAVLSLTFPAFTSPVITSVTPNAGPAAGGTAVVIHGTGFSNNCIVCSPPFADPQVYFDGTLAAAHFVDGNTIEAVTPAHLPGSASVTVIQLDGSSPNSNTLGDAFRYNGGLEEDFDPVLFPIFARPVHGRFDTEFVTTARVMAKESPVSLWGVDLNCSLIDPPQVPTNPIFIGPETVLMTDCSETVGHLFWVEKGRSDDLAANLRVTDVSRNATDHGVEIPVVRRADFNDRSIVLLGIPIEPGFRNMLRIYALHAGIGYVNVTIGSELRQVPLVPGGSDYEPAYAEVSDFPAPSEGASTIAVRVEVPRLGVFLPAMPIWAFVSVTNNKTQQITTITPN